MMLNPIDKFWHFTERSLSGSFFQDHYLSTKMIITKILKIVFFSLKANFYELFLESLVTFLDQNI